MSIIFKSILGLGLLFIISLIMFETKDSRQCLLSYPIKEKYDYLKKTHRWINTKNELVSYKNNLKDGISIFFEKDKKYNEIYFFVTKNILGKKEGFSYMYTNGELSAIDTYQDGISLSFANSVPSLLIVKHNNQSVGSLDFWEDGRIRSIKFGSKYYNKSAVGYNDTYDNGQKAFEYVEENGTKYWVVYSPKGQMLIKYPVDNDFCKAEFYEDGKKVEIPYYFDQKEFEEVYEKIRNDVNKSNP